MDSFQFLVLYIGKKWVDRLVRRNKELTLIIENRPKCYNLIESLSRPGEKNPFWGRVHSPETKTLIGNSMRGQPNHLLGRKIIISGMTFPSIAEASRKTGHSRKYIRDRINSQEWPDWRED